MSAPRLTESARLLARVRLAPGCTSRMLAVSAGYGILTVSDLLGKLYDRGLVSRGKRSGAWVWYPTGPLLLSHEELVLRALASAHGLGVAHG